MIQKLQRTLSVLLLSAVLALSFSLPSFAGPFNQDVQGLITRLNVQSLDRSVDFYEHTLGLERNPIYDTHNWTQFFVSNLQDRRIPESYVPQIGLYEEQSEGTDTSVITIVVSDIELYRDDLRSQGVEVSDITTIDHGIRLAFFKDPDGNSLAIRENP